MDIAVLYKGLEMAGKQHKVEMIYNNDQRLKRETRHYKTME